MQTLPTIKQAKQSHPLAPAVLRQLGGGVDAVQSAMDAAKYGADGGFSGFIYTGDTIAFTKRNRSAITDMAVDMASDLGEGGAIDLVRGFRCLDNPSERAVSIALYGSGRRVSESVQDEVDAVENALAWFALEEVGNAIESIGGAA